MRYDEDYVAGLKARISELEAKLSKREWVGLTDDEFRYAIREWNDTGQTVGEMICAIEAKLKEKNTPQEQSEVERLRQVCRNVYEIWAGSDGIPVPETCAEGYLLRLVEQMRDEAKAGLSEEKHA